MRIASTLLLCLLLLPLGHCARAQQNPAGLALPNTARIADAESLLPPGATHVGGLLGERFERSEKDRLLEVDEEELLAGFRHRPGKQAWIGEHVGKWLHAASLAYANTGDPALRAKLDRVAHELMKTQEPDGYLGTYTPDKRFGLYPDADWDVWVHKYDLLGLLAYYQYTGDKDALAACRRIGDLLINTFGPGKKSIISAGTHMGMAATSVLEPVVLLYRATADPRYLDFAKYIVSAWEEPNGPHILTTLENERSVRKVANAKAYEMTSNLNGLCELYRATGERRYLDDALIAWEDIVKYRLYITGSGSSFEVWQEDNHLPNGNGASICETCVTVTWEQLNLQLLRLTGESRFADQLERSVYNHLLGAQKPTGDAWCYYTPLQGKKPYGSSTNCCLSSGPRGVALLPTFVYATSENGIDVNLYTPSSARIPLAGGGTVEIEQKTDYPLSGVVDFSIRPKNVPQDVFLLNLRIPPWTRNVRLYRNGEQINADGAKPGSYYGLACKWKPGDRIHMALDMQTRLALGDHDNAGRAAILYGPLVLAADEEHNPALSPIGRIALAADDPSHFAVRRADGKEGAPVFVTRGLAPLDSTGKRNTVEVQLTPFYAAGADGSPFEVWIRRPGSAAAAGGSVFSLASESRSRPGNQEGSICDDDPGSFAVTFDGTMQPEAWFAVSLPRPVTIDRVVFAHGHSFHDGGWFDTAGGKPRIEARKTKDGPWETVATLDSYPDSTAARPGRGLRDGASFTARFAPVTVVAVRIIGKPASGDSPTQAFASCGELQAFRDR